MLNTKVTPTSNTHSHLLNAAQPTLMLLSQIKYSYQPADINALNKNCVQLLKNYRDQLNIYHYDTEVINLSLYALCVAIDEAALSAQWSLSIPWYNSTLLSQFFNDGLGGEKFYQIVHHCLKVNLSHELTALLYFIISLGFEGQYYGEHELKREALRQQLFSALPPDYRSEHQNFYIHLPDIKQNHKPKRRWHLQYITSVSAIICFCFIQTHIWHISTPVINALSNMTPAPAVSVYQSLSTPKNTSRHK